MKKILLCLCASPLFFACSTDKFEDSLNPKSSEPSSNSVVQYFETNLCCPSSCNDGFCTDDCGGPAIKLETNCGENANCLPQYACAYPTQSSSSVEPSSSSSVQYFEPNACCPSSCNDGFCTDDCGGPAIKLETNCGENANCLPQYACAYPAQSSSSVEPSSSSSVQYFEPNACCPSSCVVTKKGITICTEDCMSPIMVEENCSSSKNCNMRHKYVCSTKYTSE